VAGFHRLVRLELELKRAGILWEPPQVVVRRGLLTQLLAKQILGEDQVEGLLWVVAQRRKCVKISLGRDPLA